MNVSRRTAIACTALGKSEPETHHRFREYRLSGEWFLYTDDLKTFVYQVILMNDEHDCYATESEAYQQHEREMEAEGNKPTMSLPDWPNVIPWKLLESPADPPGQQIIGLRPVFESS
ncbi:MAG: hypothetical protein Aurels2KO_55480 [Aureliella sp.]